MAVNPTIIGRNPGLAGWAILNPRVALAEHRLMREYMKAHPACEACGESRKGYVDCHHRIPLWKWIEQAGTNPAGRYSSLCNGKASAHHLHAGHAGDYGRRFVENVSMVCAAIRQILLERKIIKRDAI